MVVQLRSLQHCGGWDGLLCLQLCALTISAKLWISGSTPRRGLLSMCITQCVDGYGEELKMYIPLLILLGLVWVLPGAL